MLVLESLVGFRRTIQFQFLQHYWLGHRLELLWYWMVCLGNHRDHSVIFEITSKYCILDSFLTLRPTPLHFFQGILAHSDRYNGLLSYFTIPVHFSSLIPKMSMFSCHPILDDVQFTLIHGPNIPGSYAVLFFTASDFTVTTRYIHNCGLFEGLMQPQ